VQLSNTVESLSFVDLIGNLNKAQC